MTFYDLQEPTAWAEPPTTWSSTSLDDVEACPRRWQLAHSRWGVFERFPVRLHPAAIEGQIIHEALDRLTRACGRRGNPELGSPEFATALADAEFFEGFSTAISDWQLRLTSHPRPGPAFRLRSSADELANRAVRLFREQYKPAKGGGAVAASLVTTRALKTLLRQRKALSEVKLTHPELPFLGILDRVQQLTVGIEIVDFKTGRPSETHRRQLLRYALLWWRNTGEAPARVIAQYLDGAESWAVETTALENVEADLRRSLPQLTEALRLTPAPAVPRSACHFCPVRARCGAGWPVAEDASAAAGRGDAELSVIAKVGSNGFLGRSRKGAEVAVVNEASVATLLPECRSGQQIRVVGGVWSQGRSQLELKAWTEVFVLAPS